MKSIALTLYKYGSHMVIQKKLKNGTFEIINLHSTVGTKITS